MTGTSERVGEREGSKGREEGGGEWETRVEAQGEGEGTGEQRMPAPDGGEEAGDEQG